MIVIRNYWTQEIIEGPEAARRAANAERLSAEHARETNPAKRAELSVRISRIIGDLAPVRA